MTPSWSCAKKKKMYFLQPTLGRDYLPAKLSQGKTWFVYFYVKSPVSGKLQRRRIKVNRYSTRKENLVLARSIIGDINTRLALGWNPLLEGVAPRAGVPLFDALDADPRTTVRWTISPERTDGYIHHSFECEGY